MDRKGKEVKNVNNKVLLIALGIMAIGLVALPQTLALFVGQHNWYDTTTSANGVPCAKCHYDVVQEISTSTSQVNVLHKGLSTDGGCQACHMTAPTYEGLVQGPSGTAANGFHAAAAPACLDCHNGVTGGGQNAQQVFYANEVHKPFVDQANSTSVAFLKGANEACIACHTHVAVDITWTKAINMSLTATETSTANSHSWIVSNYLATGTAVIKTNGDGGGNGSIVP